MNTKSFSTDFGYLFIYLLRKKLILDAISCVTVSRRWLQSERARFHDFSNRFLNNLLARIELFGWKLSPVAFYH